MNYADLTENEISQEIVKLGLPKFRGKQIFDAIINGQSLQEISVLSESLKLKIQDFYPKYEIFKKFVSKDGTKKYLIKFEDESIVECVLMSYKYGNTICVSTQVGCRMGCAFCASTLQGLKRNLSSGEILGQIYLINRDNDGSKKNRQITNIVLMGSGEPLDNYTSVVNFLKLISGEQSLNISMRNISLSTCGIVDKIDKLSRENLGITLTISLHAPNQQIREKIMPVAKAYKYEDLIKAVKRYFEKTGRRVVYEYALISGVNDSLKDAEELAKSVKGDYSYHINLIPLNEVKERGLKTSKNAYQFMEKLNKLGVSATVRRTMGEDIEGACGQLRNKILKDEN